MARLTVGTQPSLPIPANDYKATYFNQLLNTLRLFFNTIINFQRTLASDTGGSYIKTPYGAFSSLVNQTPAAADTPQVVSLEVTDYSNAMTNSAGRVTVDASGLYNYQMSVQFENANTAIKEATVWLRVNGADAPATASQISVTSKHGSINGYVIFACNFFIELTGGDYVEMWWSAASTDVIMEAYAASTSPFTRPAIPSVVATLSFVSAV